MSPKYTFEQGMLAELEAIKTLCLKNGVSTSKLEIFIADARSATQILEARYGAYVQYETPIASVTDAAERVVHQWAQSVSLHHEFLSSYDAMRLELSNKSK